MEVNGAGHMVPMNQPQAVSDDIIIIIPTVATRGYYLQHGYCGTAQLLCSCYNVDARALNVHTAISPAIGPLLVPADPDI